MVMRQLSEKQYQRLCNELIKKSQPTPLEASYTVSVTVDGAEYALKMQPTQKRKIAVLQALRVCRSGSSPRYELITSGIVLSSLLELLIYQGVA